MLLKYTLAVILILASITVHAKSLMVTTPFNSYSIDYSKDKINLTSTHYRHDLISKKCNKPIIHSFVRKLNRTLSTNALDKFQGKKQIKLSLDGSTYYADKGSQLGILLLKVPKEVRRLTIQSKMLCK